tara:strand:- start:4470 stop:6899 length:2430 start_codon:yes stop_codon:yes gene_type:complete
MTVWYFDPDGGDNSNDGQSFANRKAYCEYGNRTQFDGGDEIRFIKSPEPTSLGNATWTADAAKYNKNTWNNWNNENFGGREFQSVGVTGNAAPNPTSVAKGSHGLETGDTLWISDSDFNSPGAYEITKVDDDNFTLDGTENAPAFTTVNHANTIDFFSPFRVLLATACTKNIICYQSEGGIGDKDWTATLGTTYRETGYAGQNGWRSSRGFKPGTSGTGKAAYVELENALDLSGYQQISFKCIFDYLVGSQESADSIMSLRLCTDTSGDTSVHTIPITMGFDISDRWYSVVCDLGTNLNASIQSIALYVDTTLGHANTEVIIDNVIACKAKSSADSLTHASIISKGNTHDSEWYPIRAIDGKRILLDSNGSSATGGGTVYSGTTETVTTYKRECFRRPTFYATNEMYLSPFFTIDEYVSMDEGAAGGITVSGGWNTTDMSSQDTNSGTWFDCIHPDHYTGMYLRYTNFLNISKFGIVRGYKSYQTITDPDDDGRYMTLNNCHAVGNKYGIDPLPESTLNSCNHIRTEVYFIDQGAYSATSVWKDCKFIDASISADSNDNITKNITLLNPTIRGHIVPGRTTFFNNLPEVITISGGTINNIRSLHKEATNQSLRRNSQVKIINTLINNSSAAPIVNLFAEDPDFGSESTDDNPHTQINYNNTANDHRIYFYGAIVTSETSVRNTASGIAWKMQCTNTDALNYRHPTMNPVKWKIAETAVNASAQVTVTAYVRRSNTDFGIKLAVLARDNYHLGVTSDTSVTASGSVDAWEQITLNFTPNAAGVATIRCLFGAVGNTSYAGYIDDIAITQA